MNSNSKSVKALKVCTLTLKKKDGQLSTMLEWHSCSGLDGIDRLEALADIKEVYDEVTGQQTVCAWCEAEAGNPPRDVSHGICRRHLREMTAQLRES